MYLSIYLCMYIHTEQKSIPTISDGRAKVLSSFVQAAEGAAEPSTAAGRRMGASFLVDLDLKDDQSQL